MANMKFTLEIELGNDKMQTVEDVAAALVFTASQMRQVIMGNIAVGDYSTVSDINGNVVGKWEVSKSNKNQHRYR